MAYFITFGHRVGCTGCRVQTPLARIQAGHKFNHSDDCSTLTESFTECKSEEGVTVGLIDSILTCAHVLASRDLSGKAIKDALQDLHEDKDLAALIGRYGKQAEFIKVGEAEDGESN